MSGKRKYKTYSKEFKDDAVLLVIEHGYSVAKAAEAIGNLTAKKRTLIHL